MSQKKQQRSKDRANLFYGELKQDNLAKYLDMKFSMYYDLPSDLTQGMALTGCAYFKECYQQYESKTAELVAEAALSNYSLTEYLLTTEFRNRSEPSVEVTKGNSESEDSIAQVIEVLQDDRFEGSFVLSTNTGDATPPVYKPEYLSDDDDELYYPSDRHWSEDEFSSSEVSLTISEDGVDYGNDLSLLSINDACTPAPCSASTKVETSALRSDTLQQPSKSDPYPVERFKIIASILAREQLLSCEDLVKLHVVYNTGAFRSSNHTEIKYLRHGSSPGCVYYRQPCICLTQLIKLWHTLNKGLVSDLFRRFTKYRYHVYPLDLRTIQLQPGLPVLGSE